MAIVEATAGSAPEIEDGLYPVTIISVEQTVMENDKFGHKNKLRFKMALDGLFDDENEQVYLDPLINEKLSLPDAVKVSTLTTWAQICGVPIKNGRIDTDDFHGKRARAVIKTAKPGDWPKVTELMAVKQGQADAASNGHDLPDTAAFLQVNPSGDAVVDWPKFWALAKRYGLNAKHITDAAGIEKIEDIDPFDLPPLLEGLIAKASA